MNWSLKKFNGYCTVDLPRNIFQENMIESLKELMQDLKEKEHKIIFLNMSQIPKICSKNLALLINIYKFAEFSNIELKLYNLHSYVSHLIFQTRLNQIFDICDPANEFDPDHHHQELYLSQACQPSCQ